MRLQAERPCHMYNLLVLCPAHFCLIENSIKIFCISCSIKLELEEDFLTHMAAFKHSSEQLVSVLKEFMRKLIFKLFLFYLRLRRSLRYPLEANLD